MKLGLFVLVALIAAPSVAPCADRMTDKDVKNLVDRIDDGRDKFNDALDDKLKHDVLRGPTGEVDVEQFLKDFKENVDRLKDRLKPEYAASAEAAALLRQGSAIDRFFRQQPPGTRGESEWNRLATDLKALAAAYGTSFPLDTNAAVRRMGDREIAVALEEVAKGTDRLKKAMDTDLKARPTIDKSTREARVREAEDLGDDAKALRSRVNDGQPSSAEADRLLTHATAVRTFIETNQLPASRSVWSTFGPRLQDVAAAYGTTVGSR